MIQKIIYPLGIAVILILGFTMVFGTNWVADAASVFQTFQGGTGTSSPSGILYGDNAATTHLNTVTMGANCTFSGGVLNCTASGSGTYPFTPATFNGTQVSATSTGIWEKAFLGFIASSTRQDYSSTTAGLTNAGSTWLTGLTQGLVANDANHLLYGTATGTLQGSGAITVTAGGSVLASGAITVACATCNTSSASVTSVGSGTGLAGGPITTSGTLSLPTIVGTSSAETAANIPFYTSTNGTPALLSGGDSSFTFVSASKKLIMLNATSTNLSATGSFFVPTTTVLPTTLTQSQLAVNTTAASTSLQYGAAADYATTSVSFSWSTTSPSTSATDTIMVITGPRGQKLDNMACAVVGGTATVVIGNGAATSTYYAAKALSSIPVPTTLSANNSFDQFSKLFIDIGTYSANTVTNVSCGFGREYSY